MRLPLLLPSLSLLLLSWQTGRAQLLPADDFFNSGAQFYISNNIPSALEQVESGLKIYPDDEKLKKLEQLLKQKQQQQSQQNQQQQDQKDQKQQNQSQQQKDQQSQQQKSDDQKNQQQDQKKSPHQQKKEEQQKSEADQKKSDEEKKQEQQKSAAEKKDDKKPEDQKGGGQPVAPGQMTSEEAKRLLDAQKGREQVLKWQPKDKPENPNRVVKDW